MNRSDSGKPLLPGSSEINIPTPRPGNHPIIGGMV